MARIEFRAKVQTCFKPDDSVAYQYIRVPKLDRKHCDMAAFRTHDRYGSYANSNLFPAMLARLRQEVFGGDILRLDSIPLNVKVDTSGFLATVSFEV